MVGILGLNHKSAPVEIRERFVFREDDIVSFVQRIRDYEPEAEVAVLSTCNRTEIYYHYPHDCTSRNMQFTLDALVKFKGMGQSVKSHFYIFNGRDAVKHLFSVAAGLNSMVLGENQILGQVKNGYKISVKHGFTGSLLNKLFHKCFKAGKRVRTETSINEGVSSVSYAGVKLALTILETLHDHPVFLIGAGETGKLVVQGLMERGVETLYLTNRTIERAEELACKYGGEPISFESVLEYMTKSDIVITSTAAAEPLITTDMIQAAMAAKNFRPTLFIDLSVPRDVEHGAEEIRNVIIKDVDDLESIVESDHEKRQGEIEKAEGIIAEITDEYYEWIDSLRLSPAIEFVKTMLDDIHRNQMKTAQKSMDEEVFRHVQDMTGMLKKKYLGRIVKNMKRVSENGKNMEYIQLVHELFADE